MSIPALDEDLYGDIYNDEFSDFLDAPDETEAVSSSDKDTVMDQKELTDPPPTVKEEPADAPKEQPVADEASSVSYSAQIAQQFSAYKQTPSQERQPKVMSHPLPRNPIPGFERGHDSVFGKKPSEMHDTGKLFVGGLSWDTTDEGLRDYFSQFGKVDAVTIMRDPSGTSRGFAFLTFEDASSVDTVLSREHTLDGKTIDPKRAIPREEHLRNARYFVGGLSHSTTVESMRTFFAQFGKVVDTTVMLDRETGRSKGFGFVTFEDNGTGPDQSIVGKGHLTLDDKEIEVKLAQPRGQRDQTRNLVNKITSNRESPSSSNTPTPLSTTPTNLLPNPNLPLKMSLQAPNNPMGMMMFPRPHHLPMMANGMPMNMAGMMGMNPMMSMGMGMGMGMGGMNGGMGMNALNGMGGNGGNPSGGGGHNGNGGGGGGNGMQQPGMNMMNGMNFMQNMGAIRMGMMGGGNPGGGAPGMMGMAGMSPMAAMGMGMTGMGGMGMPGMGMGMGAVGSAGAGGFAKNGMMNPGLGPVRMNGVNRKQQHGFHPYSR